MQTIKLTSVLSSRFRFPLILAALFSFSPMSQLRAQCPDLPGEPGDYTSTEVLEFLDPTHYDTPLVVNRGFTLPAGVVLRRPVEIISPVYSPVIIDLNGGSIDPSSASGDIVQIRSLKNPDDSWCQLSDVTLKNGTIDGAVRVWGMGVNGQSGDVPESSHSLGHTQRAQAAAPTDITLENLTIVGHGRIPLYLSPGTTYATVRNCRFTGSRSSTTIYLGAESAHNTLTNNVFETVPTGSREVIAVDGSAYNTISSNLFPSTPNGGIYVYRNCGEGGAVRHQEPRFNEILVNEFTYSNSTASSPAIWLGSRNNNPRSYCDLDSSYPFGSGIDDHDFARQNSVISNNFTGRDLSDAIRDDDIENIIRYNYNAMGVALTPPIITTQPQSLEVPVGDNVLFSVVADGTAPLVYQWYYNGSTSVGGNSNILSLSNVQLLDSGDYSVVITNSADSVTSSIATLTVTNVIVPTGAVIASWHISGGDILLNVTNGVPMGTFDVLSTSDITLPTSVWLTNHSGLVFDAGGSAVVTNSMSSDQQYFRIRFTY